MAHAYKNLTPEARQELNSNFLVESWSFSKVSEFSRNEKAFEMSYIYGHRVKSSSSTVAGTAYHRALDFYFQALKDGLLETLPKLESIGFDCIENTWANAWKLQKTTPTVDDCKLKANKLVGQLLKNFFKEISIYQDDIKEILHVEMYCDEFLTINGVDIPLPCHARIDLVVRTNEDKIAVIDHKSKSQFSNQDELKLSIGRQAITYVNCYEEKTGDRVDEVWFIENKYSQNKDKSPQLSRFKIEITDDVRKLYEALLYEPLRRMISAVSDPDYVYLINDSDNFIDKAEIYNFWAKTMVAEVHEFNIAESKRPMIAKRLKKIRDASVTMVNPKIIKEFRNNAAEFIQYDFSDMDMTQEQKIEHLLRSFNVIARVAHKFDGYSSNTYMLEVSAGQKIASVHNHRLDLANVLDVPSVRIPKSLVMHEGKSYLAIETAKKREKFLYYDEKELVDMEIPIGIDNFGRKIIWDLDNHSTPHALICGATGSGKSVCINSVINYAKAAGIDDIIILDPKYEFLKYKGIAKVFNEIEEIEKVAEQMVVMMNDRVRNGYDEKKTLVVFDEFADAFSAARSGNELKIYEMVQDGINAKGFPKYKRQCTGELKSLEENLRILLQKGRSVGFRIIAATQRASVKVITGDAKVNFPVQICFRVPKEIDSKVVIDEAGAESLAGMGDGLLRSPEYPDIVRFQAYFKPDEK